MISLSQRNVLLHRTLTKEKNEKVNSEIKARAQHYGDNQASFLEQKIIFKAINHVLKTIE